MRRLLGILGTLMLTATAAWAADPVLHQDNKKGVLYVGNRAPTIDGQADDWAGLAGSSPRIWVFGLAKAPGDPAGFFALRADDRYLYVLAEVTDSVANENELPAPLAWRNDSVEIMVGVDTATHTRYQKGDNQIRLVPASKTAKKSMTASVNDRIVDTERDVKGVAVWTATGYRIEAAIPLRLLQVSGFKPGQKIRLDFQVNDGNSGERENMLHWHSKNDNTYHDPSSWGDGVVAALPGAP